MRATRSSAARSASRFCRGRGEITSEQLKRFEREARAVGALNHSNILTVYDVGVERGIPYVVSELLEGETLRSRLDAGPLPVEQALDIALQIVSGLTAAHDKGCRAPRHQAREPVRHDETASSRFSTSVLRSRPADCRQGQDPGGTSITEQGLLLGTAGYMSPEQVRGQQADARSDVFAFGAVLYEMLTGRRAFTGDSVVETMNAILTSDPPPRAGGDARAAGAALADCAAVPRKESRAPVFVDARARRRARGRPAFVDDVRADRCRPNQTRRATRVSTYVGPPSGGPHGRWRSDRCDRRHRRGR